MLKDERWEKKKKSERWKPNYNELRDLTIFLLPSTLPCSLIIHHSLVSTHCMSPFINRAHHRIECRQQSSTSFVFMYKKRLVSHTTYDSALYLVQSKRCCSRGRMKLWAQPLEDALRCVSCAFEIVTSRPEFLCSAVLIALFFFSVKHKSSSGTISDYREKLSRGFCKIFGRKEISVWV